MIKQFFRRFRLNKRLVPGQQRNILISQIGG
ncbi:MAG: hypothetical protein ACI8R8_002831 [Paraglaciecola sp.]